MKKINLILAALIIFGLMTSFGGSGSNNTNTSATDETQTDTDTHGITITT